MELTLILVTGLAGCVFVLDDHSPERLRGGVRPDLTQAGNYVVSYNWHSLLDKYGPGVEEVRSVVRKAGNLEEKNAIWDREYKAAVPKYLEAKKMIPPECTQGIEVTRVGTTEGGGGWAEFRCK